ncbi:Plug domain-containing protein [Winogradskyella algicola]|uniref:Plug domain-containing protein n=1 Tax=Winogradskyella algicola TaxID=2575815 RepID=UPI0011083C27|nr:Plug domain-containing protein [Winogradskyella algicola]
MKYTKIQSFSLLLIYFIMSLGYLSAQEYELVDTYEEYIDAPREVVYLHLNKSTYIKGESIGFTAYVLDKRDKRPSLLTTNLYVSIEDTNHKIVKQKLIKVNNGIASNVFNVDSLFNSGYYNIKAYTNWMRNFNEPNYYNESIRVIDPEKENFIEKPIINNDIDAQFLPESGHLLNGILNKVGVIVKDNQGFGVPNTKGEVIDQNNKVLTAFTTNELGIGSFFLIADTKTNYSVKINHANEDFNFPLGQTVEKNGIILSVKRLKTKLYVSITTNEDTFDIIKSKRHTLLIHNGSGYEVMDIYFTDAPVINKVIEFNSIPAGVNILTLFDENEKPIAERMFFNYEGINIEKSDKVSATGYGDSLNVKLNFKNLSAERFHNISISVLPQETQSYNRHNSILSQTFLQSYLKSAVENGRYYFSDIDQKKILDLDNLLITQGWSSYDWNNMFLPDELPHPFEQGIMVKANINDQKYLNDVYLLHHSGDNPPQYKQTSNGNKSIIFDSTFPMNSNKVYVSRINDNGDLKPANLYLQSFPNKIPKLNTELNPKKPKSSYKVIESLNTTRPFTSRAKNEQILDEVLLEASNNKELVRSRKLSQYSYGTIKVPSQSDKLAYFYLEDYLRANRVSVSYNTTNQQMYFTAGRGVSFGNGGVRNNTVVVSGRNVSPIQDDTGGGNSAMLVYFNDVALSSTGFLYRFPMSEIDYIEINRSGLGAFGGSRGANGVIKIYTSTKTMFDSIDTKTAQNYNLPLTFSPSKKFYVPKYRYYNDDFYKAYGTVDWKPNLTTDSNGNMSFKIVKPEVPITLFIEGITNDGTFIFKEKSLSLN